MYALVFSDAGEASLASLDKAVGQRVLNKLKWLVENIDAITPIPFKGALSGLCELKVGDWRVLYAVNRDDRIITVHKVGHRRDIYK